MKRIGKVLLTIFITGTALLFSLTIAIYDHIYGTDIFEQFERFVDNIKE